MSHVTTLNELFKQPDGPRAAARLHEAYKAVFEGRGSKEDADLVFVDLMVVSGYHFTAEPQPGSDAPSVGAMYELNGARRVGARIMGQLSWSRAQLEAIQAAIGDSTNTGDY